MTISVLCNKWTLPNRHFNNIDLHFIIALYYCFDEKANKIFLETLFLRTVNHSGDVFYQNSLWDESKCPISLWSNPPVFGLKMGWTFLCQIHWVQRTFLFRESRHVSYLLFKYIIGQDNKIVPVDSIKLSKFVLIICGNPVHGHIWIGTSV